jgi:peptide/nickel transport system ATP-binding protein
MAEDVLRRDNILLEVRGLKKHYPITGGILRRVVGSVKAVDGINFSIHTGETLGLVGESGCGKSTTGRTILRLHQPTAGQILFDDPHLGMVDIARLDKKRLKQVRQNMQIIFQDPFSSLDPRMSVGKLIAEPLVINRQMSKQALRDRVAELLEMVGMSPDYASRYPHAFSGGQRQRIGIARALALNPSFVVCDEPVSALDVSIQAQILNLLVELQQKLRLTYLFIAHDLAVIENISDRVAVMYVGYIVEMSSTAQVFESPKHPYTAALLASVPIPDPRRRTQAVKLPGEVPSPANPPSGCYFHPRCHYAQDICRVQRPELRDIGHEHWVACHFAEELALEGVSQQRNVAFTLPKIPDESLITPNNELVRRR